MSCQMVRKPMRILLLVERAAWTAGVAGLAAAAALYAQGALGARDALARFAVLRADAAAHRANPDQTLWSPQRIKAWERASEESSAPPPVGVLRVPRLALEAPILEGTDESELDRGLGHIAGTAPPGADEGNAGIAGHRDGFFRPLKDIRTGDVIVLETLTATHTYRVERTWIVDPHDVSVLDSTTAPSLTLVTCYPFYFVGSAPQRFIVRAVRTTR
jgi:sortase A